MFSASNYVRKTLYILRTYIIFVDEQKRLSVCFCGKNRHFRSSSLFCVCVCENFSRSICVMSWQESDNVARAFFFVYLALNQTNKIS